jgi:hypothetical protein
MSNMNSQEILDSLVVWLKQKAKEWDEWKGWDESIPYDDGYTTAKMSCAEDIVEKLEQLGLDNTKK